MTGVITLFLVFTEEGKQVGKGYMVWYAGPYSTKPELVDIQGNELEPGFYSLIPTDQHLTVLTKGIH